MSATATSDELPAGYRQGLTEKNLVALWPLMRSALPHDKPDRRTVPCVWRYRDIRPDMVKAADIAPMLDAAFAVDGPALVEVKTSLSSILPKT